jgi:arabinan endo-1,5-alpha-L-arabinosidase
MTRPFAGGLLMALGIAATLASCGGAPSPPREPLPPLADVTTYSNPLPITISWGGLVEDCPDPTIIHGQQAGDNNWYMYCTTNPLNDADRANGNYNFHLIKIAKSQDLANWTYVGDVFGQRPAWVAATAGLWAPDAKYFNGKYYLYYAASDTSLPGAGSAIGVATSSSPTGPWTDAGQPVVWPEDAACCVGSRRWVIDPDVIEFQGQKYIYFGSFFGGLSIRTLSADGFTSDPASEKPIALGDRYEGPNIIEHDGFFYLFDSSTDCCRGPLTGYTVFVGRSPDPLGPFVDRNGASFLDARIGGTPVISMNGNRWVGPGHSTVFTDFAGQDWLLYHAIDRTNPYFAYAAGFTRRPVLMDPIDWVNGWPTVRGGFSASDSAQASPAAKSGDPQRYVPTFKQDDQPGSLIASASDEFDQAQLSPQWSWVRPPDPATYRMTGSAFEWDTQAGDLYVDINNSSVLTEAAPPGDYLVEVKVAVSVPPSGSGFNYSQAGLIIYRDDDNYIKLVPVPINETRQTEFAKEVGPVGPGYPRYGNTVVGPPGDWTWLRIARRQQGAEEAYTAYTSNDGVNWVRGGTWTHRLTTLGRIGLVSQSGAGFTADFDYVRVYSLP